MADPVDVVSFPYTVPANTYLMICGVYANPPAGSGWSFTVTNASGHIIAEYGRGVYTDATAYPYVLPIDVAMYPIVLFPGDVIAATNVAGMRLLQVNAPAQGAFII